MKKNEKIVFLCFLAASICFYISAIIGLFSKTENNWVVNLCLGSAFLCLATTHLNRKEDKDNPEQPQE